MKKEVLETCERLSDYVLKWRERRGKSLERVYKKIESKGSTVFTRKDKIIVSEITTEFGQQATKINSLMFLSGQKRIKIDKKKYPRFFEYVSRTTFYPELNIEFYD